MQHARDEENCMHTALTLNRLSGTTLSPKAAILKEHWTGF